MEENRLYYGLWCAIYAYIGVINLSAFLTTAYDKIRAIEHEWRVSETTLFFLVFIGGGPGALLAMLLCWHKVRKTSFLCCFMVCFAPSAVAYGYLIACQTGNFGGEFCDVKILSP